jgi:hypothetical protein
MESNNEYSVQEDNPYLSGYPSLPQRSDRADLIDKIKPEPVVELIRNKLLGRNLVNGEWVEVQALKDRKLTEVGAWEIANLLQGVSHIGVTISKLKDSEIRKRTFSICRTAQLMLVQNFEIYGIRNTAQLRYVHEILFTSVFALLKQADEAGLQELLGKVVQENRNINVEGKSSKLSKIRDSMGLS